MTYVDGRSARVYRVWRFYCVLLLAVVPPATGALLPLCPEPDAYAYDAYAYACDGDAVTVTPKPYA